MDKVGRFRAGAGRFLRGLLLLSVCLGLGAAPRRVVKVAVFPFVPGIFMGPDGKAQGFYADMVREVGDKEAWEIQFVEGTWAEGLERVQRGEVDLLTSVARTAERDRFLDFGKEASFTVWSLLYANPGERIQSVLDVRGLRIGVMRNDMNGAHFKELCAKFNIPCEFVEFGTFPEVLQAVEKGQVQGGVTVSTFGYSRESDYRVVRTPVVFNPFDIYFATAEGRNRDLLDALDAYIRAGKGKADSPYEQAVSRWLHPQASRSWSPWVMRIGVLAVLLLGLSWGVVLVFRSRVARATREIRALNESLERELSERRRHEEVILNVASGVAAKTGDSFFHDLVGYLARASQGDVVLVGERTLKHGVAWIRTLALFGRGERLENLEYPQEGTPCDRVMHGEFCVITDGVQERYPKDDLLKDLGAQSYVGAPLMDTNGLVLGHLVLLNSRPLEHPDEVCSLIRIFSSRASAELERRKHEVERIALERQMQHAQKLESLGVLAGGIAHDFNNLLTAMLGHLNVAQVKLSPESPAQAHLDSLERIIHRTSDLTRQMLAYSGKGRFVVKPHDLNEVIHEMVHLLEVSISKRIALRLSLAEDLPTIEADATQIQQVVMNLVTNASDAIGDADGTIAIQTSVLELDEALLGQIYHSQGMQPGPHVALEVSDTGCGMSQEVMARIFDPFFTTKVSGRGLGLSATVGILRGHRGGMKIYSEPGRGTTFRLFFPAGQERQNALGEEPRTTQPTRQALVLLVDDEELIREAGCAMLEALGMSVVMAKDGQEAVEVVKEGAHKFDLVLMDLTMPRMDGREAFKAIRSLRPELPVILSSGYNEQDSIQAILGRGLAGFIQKPYSLKTLEAMLQGAFARQNPS